MLKEGLSWEISYKIVSNSNPLFFLMANTRIGSAQQKLFEGDWVYLHQWE